MALWQVTTGHLALKPGMRMHIIEGVLHFSLMQPTLIMGAPKREMQGGQNFKLSSNGVQVTQKELWTFEPLFCTPPFHFQGLEGPPLPTWCFWAGVSDLGTLRKSFSSLLPLMMHTV